MLLRVSVDDYTDPRRKADILLLLRTAVGSACEGIRAVSAQGTDNEKTGISQAVLAAFMNVAVNTVSQWERGERQPTGAALKLLHVIKENGLDALR